MVIVPELSSTIRNKATNKLDFPDPVLPQMPMRLPPSMSIVMLRNAKGNPGRYCMDTWSKRMLPRDGQGCATNATSEGNAPVGERSCGGEGENKRTRRKCFDCMSGQVMEAIVAKKWGERTCFLARKVAVFHQTFDGIHAHFRFADHAYPPIQFVQQLRHVHQRQPCVSKQVRVRINKCQNKCQYKCQYNSVNTTV